MKSEKGKRLFSLVMCCLGMLFLGVLYAWSVLKVPFASEFVWSASLLSLNYTLSICMLCAGNMIAWFAARRISRRVLLAISGALCCTGFLIVSISRAELPVLLFVGYGLLFSSGVGIGYNTLLSIGNGLFPERRGTSSGAMMMCFGLSAMLVGRVFSRLMTAAAFGWRECYQILGILIFSVMLLCAFCLYLPTANKVAYAKAEEPGSTPFQMLRSSKFWFFYIYGFLAASAGSAAISFSRDFIVFLGGYETTAVLAVGLISVFNGAGRILSGLLYDAWCDRRTMTAVSLATIMASCILFLSSIFHFWPAAMFGFLLAGMTYGSCATISSTFVIRHFGVRHFPINYSFSNSKIILSALSAPLAIVLVEKTGAYHSAFLFLLVLSFLSAVFNHLIWTKSH
ncbi:MAG: MFS transporter [Clostridia bacterium]|nr:MFS transporter [Clostridia bacterium]